MYKRLGVGVLGLLVALLLYVGGGVAFGGGSEVSVDQIPFETVPVQSPEWKAAPTDSGETIWPGAPRTRAAGWQDWLARNWGRVGALGFGLLLTYVAAATAGAREVRGRWDQFKGWVSERSSALSDWWRDTRDWVKHVGWPLTRFYAEVTWQFGRGFVFQTLNDATFGIPELLLAWRGKSPNDNNDAYFQMGRMAGARFTEYAGYLELLIGTHGFTAGGGMVATGVGAIPGGLTLAGSAVLVAVGPAHAARGRMSHQAAESAFRRTGGHTSVTPPQTTLTEKQVRKLLGPNASERAVQNFVRFQEYAVEKMVKHSDNGRVRQLAQKHGGVGSMLEAWVKEIGPDKAAFIFDRYNGRRQLIGAITENRLASRLAAQSDYLVLEVVEHTSHPGADVFFVDLKTLTPGLGDAKGSFSGYHIQDSTTISKQLAMNRNRLSDALRDAMLEERLTSSQYLEALKKVKHPIVIVGGGGAASMSDKAVEKLATAAKLPVSNIHFVSLD
jgi:hypothetical protein